MPGVATKDCPASPLRNLAGRATRPLSSTEWVN